VHIISIIVVVSNQQIFKRVETQTKTLGGSISEYSGAVDLGLAKKWELKMT